MNSALILSEHNGHTHHPSLPRLISAARQLADHVIVLLAGHQITHIAQTIAPLAGVSEVRVVDAPHLEHALAEDLAPLLAEQVRTSSISHLITAATPFGKAILPRAAALLDCAMLSDVVAIRTHDTFVRPIHAGEALATVQSHATVHILTVRAAAFPLAGGQDAAPVIPLAAPAALSATQWISHTPVDSSRPSLANARIVVAGGRGLASAEQFQNLITPLADTLNAAIGATRAAVDAGFVSNDHQIGQTGAIIAPDCYIGIGLSGAAQHLAGMRDARVIAAINKDPAAPICRHADYVLEGDLFEVVPQLLALRQGQ